VSSSQAFDKKGVVIIEDGLEMFVDGLVSNGKCPMYDFTHDEIVITMWIRILFVL
jgi:hypothetical protein